jgi:hypothetical protein
MIGLAGAALGFIDVELEMIVLMLRTGHLSNAS